jgi:hypothetical protein
MKIKAKFMKIGIFYIFPSIYVYDDYDFTFEKIDSFASVKKYYIDFSFLNYSISFCFNNE